MDYLFSKEHKSFTVRLREDGIIHLHFKFVGGMELDSYNEIIAAVNDAIGNKKVPFLISVDPFELPATEVRELIATKNGAPHSLADAILSDGLGLDLLASSYIRNKKPERPTRIFKDEKEAIEWLKGFIID